MSEHSALHLCGGLELHMMSSEETDEVTEGVSTESPGTGPGQNLEQDSTLGPEGKRDSIEEIEKEIWKQKSF